VGAGLQLGGVKGIGVAGQIPARRGELGQHTVHAAALGADGGQRDGVIALGKALLEGLLVHLLNGEEEGKFLLPCAVDGLGGFGQAGPGGDHQGDFVEVGVRHALPRRKVESSDIHGSGGDIADGAAVVHAVHVQSVRDETVRCGEESGGGDHGGLPRYPGQRLPQLGGGEEGVAVEEQRPRRVGVGDGGQGGGAAGVIQRGRALFSVDELDGGLVGVVGVLNQTEAVDEGAGGFPPQEQAAGRPVVKVEGPAGKGGLGGQTIGAAGGVEELLIAGHGTGQRQLGEKVLVRTVQAEHQRQRAAGGDPQRAFRHLPGQHFGAVLKGRELHRVGRIGVGPEHPPEREDEVLGGDGVLGGGALGGGVGQAVLQIKGVGPAVGRSFPPLAEGRLDFAVRVLSDKAAV